MRILITGGKGQLGKSLEAVSGKYRHHNLIITDVEELDITSAEQVNTYFERFQPDICINCAGYTHVDQAEKQPERAFLLNADAVGLLSEAAEKQGAKFIHISTDYVFNGQMWEPYRELDLTGPNSVYGQSKAAGEKALENADHAMIIRTSWLYSEFGKNFFKTMLSLVHEREEMRVVYDQVGTPTYASDLAEAIYSIVEKIENGNFVPGIFHFSNEGVASWYDFACEIARISKSSCKILPIETHEYPLPAPRPSYSVMNKSRIKQVYGVEVPYWRDSLEVCYGNYLKMQ